MSGVVVARKVAEVQSRVSRVRELLPPSGDEAAPSLTETEALVLNLYLALQAASDLAMHVVADRGLGVPGDARGAYEALVRASLLETELGRRLSASIGLRNRIAHSYGTLDLALVLTVARTDLGDLVAFAGRVADLYEL